MPFSADPSPAIALAPPKPTSWAYGDASQLRLVKKYREREHNYWRDRIALARRLVDEHVSPRLDKARSETVLLDVGCSVGTFAIEFARAGYRCIGLDFDPAAIAWAEKLAAEEAVAPSFVCADASAWAADATPPIDIAVCFDIFEHLHDDELGSVLQTLRRKIAPRGALVFSTTPTEYDYLATGQTWKLRAVRGLLTPLTFLSSRAFERVVRASAAALDASLLLTRGVSYRETIKRDEHCNPLTARRLTDIFLRAGWRLPVFETCNLPGPGRAAPSAFARHPIMHSHINGVAVPA